MTTNNHYVYIWKEHGPANSGLPFYVGQGTHETGRPYHRAYRSVNKPRTSTEAFAKHLNEEGNGYRVDIVLDNATQAEADELEAKLIHRLGRRFNATGILLNVLLGGKGASFMASVGHKRVLEVAQGSDRRAKISKALKQPIEYDGVHYESHQDLAAAFGVKNASKFISNGCKRERRWRNSPVTIDGVQYTIDEASALLKVSKGIIYYRLRNGIPLRVSKEASSE